MLTVSSRLDSRLFGPPIDPARPVRLPGEGGPPPRPVGAAEVRRELLGLLDGRGQEDPAAGLVAGYLRGGEPARLLLDALARAVVREDADFFRDVLRGGDDELHQPISARRARRLRVERGLLAHDCVRERGVDAALRRLARDDIPVGAREGELPGRKVSGQWRIQAVAVRELGRSGRLRGHSRRLDPRYHG